MISAWWLVLAAFVGFFGGIGAMCLLRMAADTERELDALDRVRQRIWQDPPESVKPVLWSTTKDDKFDRWWK
jgi:hypothetical protein